MEVHYVLHDFMLMTKGYEYLIGVAFLIGFSWFFKHLNTKHQK